jgi:hypothetical protein
MTNSDPESKDQHPLKSELAKLIAQLIVITLGGTAISYVFQTLGEERDARAQQAAFERQNFLDLHRDLNRLIADRVIVMDRVKARLASGDYVGALELRRGDYDKAVAAWNQNVDRLMRMLKAVNACRPADTHFSEGCSDSISPPSQDCIVYLYYDRPWDEARIDKDGTVCKPRSVHFAFRNAANRMGQLLNSDWADCLQLTQTLINREKEECSKRPLTEYSREALAEVTGCLDKVKAMRKSGLEICDDKADYELNSQLTTDLQYVRTRWAALDEWLTQIEQKFGPGNPANQPAAATTAQSSINQSERATAPH